MSEHIKLNTEVLKAQSRKMRSLAADYKELFKGVDKNLKRMNASFSSNMSKNFVAKISSAQDSFESIVQSMQNGADAALMGAKSFSEGSGVNMGEMLEIASDPTDPRNLYPNGPGVIGAVKTFLEKNNITGQTAIDIMDKIDSGDYSGALKAYDTINSKLLAPLITGNLLKSNVADIIPGPIGAILKAGTKAQTEMVESVLYHVPRDIGDIFHAVLQDDTTTADANKLFGQVLWHYGGAPLEGGFNLGKDIVKGFKPSVIDNLVSQGANPDSGISLASHVVGDYLATVYDDDSFREAYSIFDKDFGKGLMDSMEDISDYSADKIAEFVDNLGVHSILK